MSLLAPWRAGAHAGHGDEPFARRFEEFATTQFKVRPLPASEPTSYVLFPDGRRVTLDSELREAVRRMAGSLAEAPESEELYRDVRWREWSGYYAKSAVANVRHLFSRRFVLELAGSGVRAFYRFGTLAATLILSAEIIEHTLVSPFFPYVPLCQAVYAGCAFFTRETQEMLNAMNPQHLEPLTFSERMSLWFKSRRGRAAARAAMKNVYRAGDGVEMNRRARNRSFRDLGAGAEQIYGSWFNRGFFRSTLADPAECEECDDDHASLRYGNFGRARTPRSGRPRAVDLDSVEVPVIADLSRYAEEGVRILKTEEYLSFVELIFEQAQLAAGDLTRARDGAGEGARRVPLGTTARRAPGFFALNRDLARLRKSLDLYSFGLRMRAFRAGPRAPEAEMVDRAFAASLGEFIKAYSARLREIDALAAAPLTKRSPLRTIPARSLRAVRRWMRSAPFCEGLLTAGLLESAGQRATRLAPRAAAATVEDDSGVEGLFDLFK